MRTLVLILALLAASPALAQKGAPKPPTDGKPATLARWAKANVIPGHYRIVIDDDPEQGIYLMAPAFNQDTTGQTVRMWVRTEYYRPDEAGVRSDTGLAEIDCAERRARTLTLDRYKGQNLTDPLDPIDYDLDGPKAARWQYARPGSFGETMIDMACAIRASIWPTLKEAGR
jgi:hypothetical protein